MRRQAARRTTPPVSNAKLEADILRGDREAVAAALLLLSEKVVQSRLYQFPPSLEAEDVVQDAAFYAWQRLAGWRPEKGTAANFAVGAIRFVVQDRAFKARRRARHYIDALDVDRMAA